MKTLTLTEKELAPVLNAPNDVAKDVIYAIVRYCVNNEEPEFDDQLRAYIFNTVRPIYDAKKGMSRGGSAHKNAGNNHASKEHRVEKEIKGQSKPNQSLIKAQSKPPKNGSKKIASTDTCEASKSKPNQSLPKLDFKENEKEEERKEFPPNTPLVENKEEEKVKEKEEIQREDEDLTFNEKDKAKSFEEKMKEHYPRVMSMKKPLTHDQYRKLVNEDKYKVSLIKETLEAMENSARLHKDYISSYLTLRNWIKQRLK